MDENTRKAQREDFNAKFLRSLEDGELHYVYALVDQVTRTIGYFGVTNDPISRRMQHMNDLWYRKDRRHKWRERFKGKPEMVLLVVCPNRLFAEVVESTLIGRYGNGCGIIINEYKYWNPEQAKKPTVQDDLPYLDMGVDDGFMVDWPKQMKSVRWSNRKEPS